MHSRYAFWFNSNIRYFEIAEHVLFIIDEASFNSNIRYFEIKCINGGYCNVHGFNSNIRYFEICL